MKQCAIISNKGIITKIVNLKKKYDKIINDPNIQILEECDLDDLNITYNKYNKKDEIEESNIKLFYFKSDDGKWFQSSIYETIPKGYVKITKQEYYER